jgi:hypothetical protein
MKTLISPFEQELDVIRDRICEKIRGMTPLEEIAYFDRQTEAAIKQYGLRLANPQKK